MSRDKILLKNIHADILVGIHPEEKEFKQPIIVNVVLLTDLIKPALTDNIEDAVDYSVIHDRIVSHLNSTQYDLIEALAESISEICLADSRVAVGEPPRPAIPRTQLAYRP